MIGGRSRLRVSGGRLLKGGTSMNRHCAWCPGLLVLLLGMERGCGDEGVVQTRYWVVRLHAAPRLRGVWLVLPDHGALLGDVVGVGLFLENCIVDASIL
jgi:hypothetical protein